MHFFDFPIVVRCISPKLPTTNLMNDRYIFPLAALLITPSTLQAQWALVDDMEGDNNWIGNGTFSPDPVTDNNQVFTVENTGARELTNLALPTPIPDGSTATLFFRMRSSSNAGAVNWVVGSSDVAAPTNWPDYEGYIRLADEASPGEIDIDARNAGGFTRVGAAPADTWINVWLVLDNSSDITDVYYNTEIADATDPSTISLTGLGFRNGTADALTTLLAINNEPGTIAYLDDVHLDLSGQNLTHPLGGDSDNDNLADFWENLFFGDLSRDGTADSDSDDLTDAEEFQAGTNPTLADTDGDTISDSDELDGSANPFDNAPTNPLAADTDGDGYDDAEEGLASSNPNDHTNIPTRPTGFQLVENFEGPEMVVGSTFDGVNGWKTNANNIDAISVFTEEGSSDQVGRLERTDTLVGSNPVSRNILDLNLHVLEGGTGTLFFQALASSGQVDQSLGLSDSVNPAGFGDFEAQVVLYPGNTLRARDAGAFRDLGLFAENTWMNVWIVADNSIDQVKIYVESPDGETGQIEITDDGGLDPFDFRNGTATTPLNHIHMMTAAGSEIGSFVLVDNIYVDPSSANLSTPAPSKGAPGEIKITSTSLAPNGDLFITFSPGGEGFILTASDNLENEFEEADNAIFDGEDVFTVPAASLTTGRHFFRVEKR